MSSAVDRARQITALPPFTSPQRSPAPSRSQRCRVRVCSRAVSSSHSAAVNSSSPSRNLPRNRAAHRAVVLRWSVEPKVAMGKGPVRR